MTVQGKRGGGGGKANLPRVSISPGLPRETQRCSIAEHIADRLPVVHVAGDGAVQSTEDRDGGTLTPVLYVVAFLRQIVQRCLKDRDSDVSKA